MDTHIHTLLAWTAKSQIDHARSNRWYVIGGVLCGLMIVYGIVTGAYTEAVVFLLLPGAFYLIRNQSHTAHDAQITDAGFIYDGTLTPWSELKEFWILRGSNYYELHIDPVSTLKPEIVIQTGDIDPILIRDTLLEFVAPAVGKKERIVDALIRFCKL